MGFHVEFRAGEPHRPHPLLVVPEPASDHEVDVIEACDLLARAGAGEFVMSGFGRDRWPLDVAYDMAAFVEQLPALLHGMMSGSAVEVDLYGQGVESSLVFCPTSESVEIVCRSRTAWRPDPAVEEVARQHLIEMWQNLATTVAAKLAAIAPRLAATQPFNLWARGVF